MNNKRLASEAMNEYALESAFARHLIDPARPEGAEGPCCWAGVSRQIGDRLVQSSPVLDSAVAADRCLAFSSKMFKLASSAGMRSDRNLFSFHLNLAVQGADYAREIL